MMGVVVLVVAFALFKGAVYLMSVHCTLSTTTPTWIIGVVALITIRVLAFGLPFLYDRIKRGMR